MKRSMHLRSKHLLLVVLACVGLLIQGAHAETELTTGRFHFADIMPFFQMHDNHKPDTPAIVFLHSEMYTSEHWVNLGTLSLLRRKGYRTVAIDLPGYGKTQNLPYIDNNMRAEFVKSALEFAARGANITKVGSILVTPSMSGTWAIPFLDRYGIMLKGWLALSPSGVMKWGGPWEDTHKKVRLLAMYGNDDTKKPQADNLLKLFSKANKVIVPNAKESCYMDQPDVFHQHLTSFVQTCFAPEPKRDL